MTSSPASPGSARSSTAALAHLEALVAFDTRNPPRAGDGTKALFRYVANALAPCGFDVVTRELADGCAWLLARRGRGGVLVNIHVDTVPADPAWASDPHVLLVERAQHGGGGGGVGGVERAVGLGACDIKGALACFLDAVARTNGAVDLLLTNDEEAGSSTCINTFVAEHKADVAGRRVMVAEPTQGKGVLAHRGIATANGVFHGVGGHASHARALVDSAVHEAVRWADHALAFAAAHDVRFNLGRIEGGQKANMIAASANVRFGVRPLEDPARVVDEVCALAPHADRVQWTRGYLAPALVATDASRTFARDVGVAESAAVDFFTEAALFAQAGATAIVVGPGDIAQAHTAGEFVDVTELTRMTAIYERLSSA